ncbi:hypothetical protein PHMEG_00014602 [Phytophthora megakarya]|uniref:Uncharacterized protein n=1 Tax=Phytophthora megakarya TaxID=4795 RepID=A0A225W4Z8_9STRA|nr:hypothetical protein PHMEG_00014602 [Phytophthora megakarya]
MEDAVVVVDGKMSRQSRRTRGLQPEEQKPLEVIEKEARARRAVAREEKKVAGSKDARTQPDPEEEIQDAHHVTLDGIAEDDQEESAPDGSGADSNSDSSMEILGVSGPDMLEQVPVGGTIKVESPAVDGTSEKSQLGHDVIEVDALEEKTIPGETPTTKLEGPLSTVKEEATSDSLGDDSQSRLETSVSSSSCVQVPKEEATSRMQIPRSTQGTVDQNSVVPNLVKLYVDDQVRRWEQGSLEFVMSPMIEYAWLQPMPNIQAWYGTVMATSEYLASRMASGARAQTWISEWRLVRLASSMAVDFASVRVPLNELSMRECAAVLQTMFFEVGVKFRNLVPAWFRVCTPKAEVDTMGRVAEKLQHLLAVELLEWQQVISGVQCRVVSPLDARNLNGHSEEMKPEDAEGDSLMSSYEAELFGRGPAEAVSNEATNYEAARSLKAAETQFEERWQRREAEAEKAKESWATNLQKILNDQWEFVMSAQMQRLQDEITSLKETRNQNQKAIRSSKNIRGTVSSNTRATSTKIQGVRSTVHPRSCNAIKDDAVHNQDTSGDSAFAVQLQLTLPSTTETKYDKGDTPIKEEQGSRIAKTSGSRVRSRQTEAKSTGAARSEGQEPPKKEPRKKPSRRDEDPSGPSSSGESREEDDNPSDSDSLSDGMPLRDYANARDDFDEKQSPTARRRWWEKFLNMTIQAGKRVRTNWGRLTREFKCEYCRSRVSDSEKYYTMKQYKDETALAFLYRLNLAAERADVKFRKSERRREQHIKRFIKNLMDMSLRSTLQSQRFYKVSDLEYVLKQQEEVNASGSYSTRPPPNRDFRADNVARGGMRQRNSNRAYVARDDEDVDVEKSAQMEQNVDENDVAFQELSTAIQDAQILVNPNGTFLSREELIHEVYRIMNNVGWKPANPNARSGSSANPSPPLPPPAQPAAFQGYQSYHNPDRLEFYVDTQREVVWPSRARSVKNITMDIATSGRLSKSSRNSFFKEA